MGLDQAGWIHGSKSIAGVENNGVFTPSFQLETGSNIVSQSSGQAYSLATTFSATSNDYLLYLRNDDDDMDMIVRRILTSGSASSIFALHEVTGTAAGTSAVPVNLNLGSANTASVTALANAAVTGLSKAGETIVTTQSFSSTGEEMTKEDGIVVPSGSAIAIQTTHAGASSVACYVAFTMEPAVDVA